MGEEPTTSVAGVLKNGFKKRAVLDIDALWRRKLEKEQNILSTTPPSTHNSRNCSKRKRVSTPVKMDKRNFERDDVENAGGDMESMQLGHSPPTSTPTTTSDTPRTSSSAQYEYATLEYQTSVTPATYTVYAPDTNNYAYYQELQYASSMQPQQQQASPPDAAAYMVVQQQNPPNSNMSMDDSDGSGLGHTTRASPATIQWLLDNYETSDGTSLPRCTLYDHYKKHCVEHRLDPVNAASFGKLIRSVFLGLKTRRLGTRGNSKYHYFGIRIKPDSPLNRTGTSTMQSFVCHQPPPPSSSSTSSDVYADTVNSVAASVEYAEAPRPKRANTGTSSSSSGRDSVSPGIEYKPTPVHGTVPIEPLQSRDIQEASTGLSAPPPPPGPPSLNFDQYCYYVTEQDRAEIGHNVEMPHIPFQTNINIEAELRKIGMCIDHIEKFINCYHFMCKQVLDHVKQLEFQEVAGCWLKFWTGNEYTITRDELSGLCTLDAVQDYMIEIDLALYQSIVDALIPNILMSRLSDLITQYCRKFAKNVDIFLKKALLAAAMPENVQKKKLQALRYMQQGLKRYTALNHLAQAARSVLEKRDLLQKMYAEYERVDMKQVHEQAGWICGCDTMMVQHVNAAFKLNLQKVAPMEEWTEWLESIVDQVLAKYHDKPVDVIANVGKQFLLNWSFYTSMIIRDLTLRSTITFGSFHLIRLLADDYMYYLIESKIAKAGKQQIITVIRQEKDYPLFSEHREYIIPADMHDPDQLILDEDILSAM